MLSLKNSFPTGVERRYEETPLFLRRNFIMSKTLIILISLVALILVTVSPAPADIINYSNFSSTNGLEINPGAGVTDGKLDLTKTSNAGSVFYNSTLTLPTNYAFATTFTFSITGSDGLIFCLHQDAIG